MRSKMLIAIALLGSLTLLGCAEIQVVFSKYAPKPSTPAAKVGHGAIAFSPVTLRWHMRWNVVSPVRASVVAIEQCGAADCQIVLTFGPGQCGTFSLDDLDALSVGSGKSKLIAHDEALGQCAEQGQGCKVAPAQCNN